MKIKPETEEALRLMREGATAYKAAKITGIALTTALRAREREESRCCTCGQVVRKVEKKPSAVPLPQFRQR